MNSNAYFLLPFVIPIACNDIVGSKCSCIFSQLITCTTSGKVRQAILNSKPLENLIRVLSCHACNIWSCLVLSFVLHTNSHVFYFGRVVMSVSVLTTETCCGKFLTNEFAFSYVILILYPCVTDSVIFPYSKSLLCVHSASTGCIMIQNALVGRGPVRIVFQSFCDTCSVVAAFRRPEICH